MEDRVLLVMLRVLYGFLVIGIAGLAVFIVWSWPPILPIVVGVSLVSWWVGGFFLRER